MTARASLAFACSALLAIALLSGTRVRADDASVRVDVHQQDDAFIIDATLTVPVPVATAWEVLTDFDGMHRFVPNLRASHVVRTDGQVVVIAQRGVLRFGLIEQPFDTERRIELEPMTRMRTTQLAGSMRRLESTTTFAPLASGARLDYRVELVPGSFMPDFITRWFLDYEFRMQLGALAQEMERRHGERRSAGPSQ